jgi:Flp pilus assembly protein TadD
MIEFGTVPHREALARSAWSYNNDQGLAHAAEGEWSLAVEAFEAAVDVLTRDEPMRTATHEPLALVTGNLAQAAFRAGRLADALHHAQRTCALRTAITGEDGMPVARARMDLAVMLATAGRGEEALALIQRAIAAIEHHVGSEDIRVAVVLENTARIALALGDPSNAEPVLLRLHALLRAHERSTEPADTLLARTAEARGVPHTSIPASAPSTVALAPPTAARGGEMLAAAHLNLDDLQEAEGEVPEQPVSLGGCAVESGLISPAFSSSPALVAKMRTPPEPPSTSPESNRVLSGRSPSLVWPTPGGGASAVEAPARTGRVGLRSSERRDQPPPDGASRPEQGREAAVHTRGAPKKPGSTYAPMIIGLTVVTTSALGVIWWFLLR